MTFWGPLAVLHVPWRLKPRPVKFLSDPIEAVHHFGTLENPPLELQPAGKVGERDAEQDGEKTLAGEYEHRDAQNDEDNRKEVFQEAKRNTDDGGLFCQPTLSLRVD